MYDWDEAMCHDSTKLMKNWKKNIYIYSHFLSAVLMGIVLLFYLVVPDFAVMIKLKIIIFHNTISKLNTV